MKKIRVILLTLMFIILIIGISYGVSDTYQVKMDTNKVELLTGETIKIPVKIENIELENGIVAFSTLLSYNENVLEEPEIIAGTNWEKPNVVEHFIQSITSTMQPVKENQEIMILSFKVKDNAQLGTTKVVLSKFEISDGENTIATEDTSINLNIITTQAKLANFILDNVWFNQRNIIISSIISIVTLLIIILITIYYIQHREKKQESNILYEEVKGISEDKSEIDNEETKK